MSKKCNLSKLAVSEYGFMVFSVLAEKLVKKNYKTAIISCGNITDATPASFYAHQSDRSYNEAIAEDFLSNPSDVLIGGGTNEFKFRKDGENLIKLLQQKGILFQINSVRWIRLAVIVL